MLRPGAKLPRILFHVPEIMVLLPQWQYRKPHHKTDSGWLFATFSIASPIFFNPLYKLLPVPPPLSLVSC
jgi:hypothetical protein